jgi:site-specific recombinase XerD
MTHLLAPLIKRFFSDYLVVQKGLSINTVSSYRDAIKLLLCYGADTLKKSVDELMAEDLTESLVLNFLDHVEKKRNCTAHTRNARLAAIRNLFGFIAREEPVLMVQCRQVRAIPSKRTEHRIVDYLEEKELQAVLDSIDINSRTGIRDRALLMVLYNTGARVSEIVNLKLEDLRLTDTAQVHLLGKGKKHRSCPIWPKTVTALEAYLKQRRPNQIDVEQVFLNANGDPITRFGIRHITRKYGIKAQSKCPSIQSKPVNPHTLRHTTAMHQLRSGNDIYTVSSWLGHAHIDTTHIYAEIDMDMKRKMLEKGDAPKIRKKALWQKPNILKWLDQLTQASVLCEANCGPNNIK